MCSRRLATLRVSTLSFTLALLPSCAWYRPPSDADLLRAGAWVEMEGALTADGQPRPDEVLEVPAEDGASPDKLEIEGPLSAHLAKGDDRVQLLGQSIAVTNDTRFENLDRDETERFELTAGDWVKLKVRQKDDGPVARVVRRVEPQDEFEVAGQVTSVERDSISIGGLMFPRDESLEFERDEQILAADPLARFFEDETKGVLFSFAPTPTLLLGGQVSVEATAEDERDLRRTRDRDDQEFSGELKVDALWRAEEASTFVLVEGTFGIDETLRNETHDETDYTHRLSRAYLFWAIDEHVSILAGRQDFDEEREWVYDETLDALRVLSNLGPIDLELSVSTGREFLEQDNDTEGIHNLIGLLRYHLTEDHFLSAWVVERSDDSPEDFNPLVFGVRSFSRPTFGLRHWLELAASRGRAADADIEGHAIDGGLTYVFETEWRPAITVGVAYATGSNDSADQRGAFRQTGLQDNNDKFGGVTSFRYYGELLDPELTNLLVTTFGVGVRPAPNVSIDLVGHTYRQVEASTDLINTNLRESPTGASRDLGWAIECIVGYRLDSWLSAELVLSRFDPGQAFERNDPAHLAAFQVRAKF